MIFNLKHGHAYMYTLKMLETSMTSSDLVCQNEQMAKSKQN